jgi:hypothetical protein
MESRFIPVEPIGAAVPAPAPQAASVVLAPIPPAATGGAFQRLSAALGGTGSGTSLKRGREAGAWTSAANKGRSEKLPRADPIHGQEQPPQHVLCRKMLESALISSMCSDLVFDARLSQLHPMSKD